MDAQGLPALDAEGLLAVLDGVSVLLYVQDPDGRVSYVNRAACELIGKTPEEIVGRMPDELFDPVTVARWSAQNEEVLRTGRPMDMEDGWGGRTFVSHKTPVFDAGGRPLAVIGLSTEITEQKRAEEALRLSEAHLAEAQQIAGVGSWHWDAETRAVEWSAELRRIYGVAAGEERTGADAIAFVHPDDRERVREATQAALREGGTMELELRIVRPDGEERLVLCRAGVTRGPDGAPRRLDGTCEDITERRRAEERRLHEALHDPLTGLPNRVLFFDRLDHAMRRQQREHAPLAVLFLDFDGFKAVNDRFGHAGGDEVLRSASALIESTLRGEDTVARFGGDELVVLSEHIVDGDDAARIAQRILDRLGEPIELDGERLSLSASIGICMAPVGGGSRDELLNRADAAMYRAKAAGPGRYVIAD